MDQALLRKARRRLLKMHFDAKCGHIGGNLSCLDILMTLYHDVMKPEDQFILSKGHSAGSWYVALWSKGILTDEDLQTFHQDGTSLPGHPPINRFSDIIFGTGSLGHGVSLACGLSIAKKLKGESGRVFVLCSDGEYNEGSTWEGLMFAAHHKLDNLIIIVDNNGLQGFGRTKEVSGLDLIPLNFLAFGAECFSFIVDNISLISNYIEECSRDKVLVLIVQTIKGQGVSFMENRMDSHYLPLSKEQYEMALMENPE